MHKHKQSRHIKVQLWTLRNQWTLVFEEENISLEIKSRDGDKEGSQTGANVQVVGAPKDHTTQTGYTPYLATSETIIHDVQQEKSVQERMVTPFVTPFEPDSFG